MPKVRKRVIVKGRVQGVWFRATLQEKAFAHNVTGWVKNNYDGSVEAVLEGEKENTEKIIKWCHRGPRGSIVDEVEVKVEEYTGEFSTFSIKYNRW